MNPTNLNTKLTIYLRDVLNGFPVTLDSICMTLGDGKESRSQLMVIPALFKLIDSGNVMPVYEINGKPCTITGYAWRHKETI